MDLFYVHIILACLLLVALVCRAVTIWGAARMLQGKSYGMGVTGSILAMIPCSPLWLVSLPMAIWSLAVLNRRDVKLAFRGQGDGPPTNSGVSPDDVESSPARFSRKAIVGACWAAYFFVAMGVMVLALVPVQRGREESHRTRTEENLRQLGLELQNEAEGVEQGNQGNVVEAVAAQDSASDQSDEQADVVYSQPPPTAVYGVVLLVLLVVFGFPALLAPFGTTILGFIAVSDIRHSKGKLTGLGLAYFDAGLFPTLLLLAVAMVPFLLG